jgi:hypothetical protein
MIGFAATEHRFDEIAGHAGEGEQILHVHGDEGPDDVVHVAARAEVPAIRQKHHGADVIGIAQVSEGVASSA